MRRIHISTILHTIKHTRGWYIKHCSCGVCNNFRLMLDVGAINYHPNKFHQRWWYNILFTWWLEGSIKWTFLRTTVQLKFNFTLARKDTRAFASFLHGITEYFLSIWLLLAILVCARAFFLKNVLACMNTHFTSTLITARVHLHTRDTSRVYFVMHLTCTLDIGTHGRRQNPS